ncbi:MAG TPA: HIT domain-containing protein [Pyrinomonadaceae bacterium]|jgi:hypothetical protein
MLRILRKTKAYVASIIALVVGIVLGGYLFSDTQPRSFLALHRCGGTCMQPKDLAGLMASIGIQKFPALIPSVVLETEKTIVVEHPAPEARLHYLIFPKKDIRNIAEVSTADEEYLLDVVRVAGELARGKNLTRYRLITNGTGFQGVTYLHFHLIAQ